MIPAGFCSHGSLHGPTHRACLFVLDGSDAQTANTVLGYARQIVASRIEAVVRHRDPGLL